MRNTIIDALLGVTCLAPGIAMACVNIGVQLRGQLPMRFERKSAAEWPVGPALHGAKRELRDDTLAIRNALPTEARAQAEAVIAQRLIALPSFVAAHTVLL